jgi:hypothetical protein
MTAPWLRRLQGTSLLVLFLFGGPGIPGADALFFHWGSPTWREAPAHHVEAGDASCHPERCLIGLAAVSHRLLSGGAPVVSVGHETDRAPVQVASLVPAPAPPRLSLPRSPPLSL